MFRWLVKFIILYMCSKRYIVWIRNLMFDGLCHMGEENIGIFSGM